MPGSSRLEKPPTAECQTRTTRPRGTNGRAAGRDLGGQVTDRYATLGRNDFVVTLERPDVRRACSS